MPGRPYDPGWGTGKVQPNPRSRSFPKTSTKNKPKPKPKPKPKVVVKKTKPKTVAPATTTYSSTNKPPATNKNKPKNTNKNKNRTAKPTVQKNPIDELILKAIQNLNNPPSYQNNSLNRILSSIQSSLIDPTKYAESLANAQYDSSIARLERERADIPEDLARNLQQIQDWYGQVETDFNLGQERLDQASAQGIAGIQDAAQGFVEGLGGESNPASALIGTAAQQSIGGLSNMRLADQIYDADMVPAIGLQRTQSLVNEQRYMNDLARDLLEEITGLTREKGEKKSALMQEGKANRFNQLLSLAGLTSEMESSRLGYGQAQTKNTLDTIATLVNAMATQSMLPIELQKGILGNQLTQAQIGETIANIGRINADTRKTLAELTADTGGALDPSEPQHVSAITEAVVNDFTTQDPKTGARYLSSDPLTVYQTMVGELQNYGANTPFWKKVVQRAIKRWLAASKKIGLHREYSVVVGDKNPIRTFGM